MIGSLSMHVPRQGSINRGQLATVGPILNRHGEWFRLLSRTAKAVNDMSVSGELLGKTDEVRETVVSSHCSIGSAGQAPVAQLALQRAYRDAEEGSGARAVAVELLDGLENGGAFQRLHA